MCSNVYAVFVQVIAVFFAAQTDCGHGLVLVSYNSFVFYMRCHKLEHLVAPSSKFCEGFCGVFGTRPCRDMNLV